MRETLFNWLQPVIHGARCLDMFAGTGILGFEALSRGAAEATMVEQEAQLVTVLQQQVARLEVEEFTQINHISAMTWAAVPATSTYNIVFLDPPFGGELAEKACELLVNNGYLSQNAKVYVESEPGLLINNTALQQIKQKTAGKVQYQLLEYNN